MQYLKEEIRNRIITAALAEFKEKGYLDASMRMIAGNAGVAIGNVYRYFKNKDELFNAIMEPVYTRFVSLVLDLYKTQETIPKMQSIVKDITDKIMEVFEKHDTEFMILMDKSRGSKYQNIKDDFIRLLNDRLRMELQQQFRANSVEIDDSFIYIIASTFVEGIFIIFRQYKDQAKIKKLIGQLLILFFENLVERFK